MSVHQHKYFELKSELAEMQVQLVAVSKTQPVEAIQQLYRLGQVDFGENYVQELVEKAGSLPPDIRWHFIGHLQTNKVKLIVPFVQLIQGVDSLKLLKEIDKQAKAIGKKQDCLLQVHIASEETKFGMTEPELEEAIKHMGEFDNVQGLGLMGMASFSDNKNLVRSEFQILKGLFDKHAQLPTSNFQPPAVAEGLPQAMQTLSMGMTSDYKIAIEEGSKMVRIGSLLFGERKP